MIKTSTATMFPGTHRILDESEKFRCYSTFNPHDVFPFRRQFGSLIQMNDVTLGPLESIELIASSDMSILLVPTVGVIEAFNVVAELIIAGKACRYLLSEGEQLRVKNPQEDQLVNYLQFNFSVSSVDFSDHLFSIDSLAENKNKIVELFFTPASSPHQSNTIAKIGLYEGRTRDVYDATNERNHIFVFVLQGAFEVEDRLLEARDALGLYDCSMIEYEALSNEAIIIIIEMQ